MLPCAGTALYRPTVISGTLFLANRYFWPTVVFGEPLRTIIRRVSCTLNLSTCTAMLTHEGKWSSVVTPCATGLDLYTSNSYVHTTEEAAQLGSSSKGHREHSAGPHMVMCLLRQRSSTKRDCATLSTISRPSSPSSSLHPFSSSLIGLGLIGSPPSSTFSAAHPGHRRT